MKIVANEFEGEKVNYENDEFTLASPIQSTVLGKLFRFFHAFKLIK